MLSISGYGQDGPFRDKAGHDLNYLATAGVLGLAGPPDRPPPVPAIQLADIAGGALFGAVGILAALLRARAHRPRAAGRRLDVRRRARLHDPGPRQLRRLGHAAQARRRAAQRRRGVVRRLSHQGRALLVGRRARAEVLGGVQRSDRPARRPCRSWSPTPPTRRACAPRSRPSSSSKTRDEWEAILTGDVCVEPVLGADELAQPPAASRARHVLRARRPDADAHAVRRRRRPPPAPVPRRRRRGDPARGRLQRRGDRSS